MMMILKTLNVIEKDQYTLTEHSAIKFTFSHGEFRTCVGKAVPCLQILSSDAAKVPPPD